MIDRVEREFPKKKKVRFLLLPNQIFLSLRKFFVENAPYKKCFCLVKLKIIKSLKYFPVHNVLIQIAQVCDKVKEEENILGEEESCEEQELECRRR